MEAGAAFDDSRRGPVEVPGAGMILSRRSVLFGLAASAARAQQQAIAPDRLRIKNIAKATIGGVEIEVAKPPKGYRHAPEHGLIVHESMRVTLVHAWPQGQDFCGEARGVRAPNGDYIVMFPAGSQHYGHHKTKTNEMVLYRSSDRGRTWSGPEFPWKLPYNQHAFVGLVPRGSKEIYAFGTEPRFDVFDGQENAPIGWRKSSDNGHTWSEVQMIRPVNDPEFTGMYVLPACETDRGTWILAPHAADWLRTPIGSWMYVLRSTDRGKTWTVLPNPRPRGWTEPSRGRLEEGRPIALGNGAVMIMVRTATGRLWKMRSVDDGLSWSQPEPTTLIQPSAPPMLFHLSDGKTLAAFHHNRFSGISNVDRSGNMGQDRSELWVSFSKDGGIMWSKPEFVLANTAEPAGDTNSWKWSVSYVDAIVDRGLITLIIAHQHKRVITVAFEEKALKNLLRGPFPNNPVWPGYSARDARSL
jgi:hypothetical protein